MKRANIVLLILLIAVIAGSFALAESDPMPKPSPVAMTPNPPITERTEGMLSIEISGVYDADQPGRNSSWTGPFPYVPVTIPEPERVVGLLEPDFQDYGVPLTSAEIKDEGAGLLEPNSAMTFIGRFDIVGYDLCETCCGKTDGITRSGTVATVGRTVAVNGLPFGTVLYIDGIGERVVEDRGYLADGVIDVLCNNHAECYEITSVRDVWIFEEGTI